MKFGLATLSCAVVTSAILCLSTAAGWALPSIGVSPAVVTTTRAVTVEKVGCRCTVHRHRSRRVYVEPAPEPYVFPAPPVGITLRKIFGLGYL